MKCLICNKELTGNVCERCGFPKISVVGGAEDDPVVKTAVHDYKENILKKNHCRDGNLSVQRRRKQTGPRADRPDSDWKTVTESG